MASGGICNRSAIAQPRLAKAVALGRSSLCPMLGKAVVSERVQRELQREELILSQALTPASRSVTIAVSWATYRKNAPAQNSVTHAVAPTT